MQQLEQQLWPVTIQTPQFVELSCMYNEVIEMVYIGKKHSCTVWIAADHILTLSFRAKIEDYYSLSVAHHINIYTNTVESQPILHVQRSYWEGIPWHKTQMYGMNCCRSHLNTSIQRKNRGLFSISVAHINVYTNPSQLGQRLKY